MFEFRHGADRAVEDHELAGLGIYARAHQPARDGDHRVRLMGVCKILQKRLLVRTGGNLRDVMRLFPDKVFIFIHQGIAHALSVVDVLTEHNGFRKAPGFFQKVGDAPGNGKRAFFHDQCTVKILLFIYPVLKGLSVDIQRARCGTVSVHVYVQIDADDLVWGKEAVVNASF